MYRVTVIPTRLYDDQYNAPSVIVVKTEQEDHLPVKQGKFMNHLEYLNNIFHPGFWVVIIS